MKITSAASFSHCPYCGREVNREEKPIAVAEVDGETEVVKTNLEVSCPEHGVLYV